MRQFLFVARENMGLAVRTVSELHERYPALKQLWRDYRQVYSAMAMESFEAQGGSIVSLSDEQRREWAASVPDLAGAWVADIERKGLWRSSLARTLMRYPYAHRRRLMSSSLKELSSHAVLLTALLHR